MRRLIISLMIGMIPWLTLAAPTALPPAPANGIRDDAHVFTPAGEAALVREMEAFHQATGIRLFIDTNTYLESGANTNERARKLVRAWNGTAASAIICLNRASELPPSVYASEGIWNRGTTLELVDAIRAAMAPLLARPLTETDALAGARALMKELTRLERNARNRDRLFQRHDAYLAAAFIAALMVGGLLTWLGVRLLRRDEAERAVQHLFPDVEVGQRFGATCGGGVIVAITYRK